MLLRDRMDSGREFLSEHEFLGKVDSNLIAHAVIHFNSQNEALNEITGEYYRTAKGATDGSVMPFRARVRLTAGMEERLFSLPQFEPQEPNPVLMNALWSVLPIIGIAAVIWFFFVRQIRKASMAQPGISKIRARRDEQQDRMDKVLDKWEEQGRRMDAILDKMERENRSRG
jgi:ATP-dependent Zn protease